MEERGASGGQHLLPAEEEQLVVTGRADGTVRSGYGDIPRHGQTEVFGRVLSRVRLRQVSGDMEQRLYAVL